MEYNMEYSAGKMGDLRSTSAQLCRSDDEDLTLPKGRCVFFLTADKPKWDPKWDPKVKRSAQAICGFTNGLILKLLACLHFFISVFF